MWIGALINPLPPLGVAKDMRPYLLMLPTAEDRVDIAIQGLMMSIANMAGTEWLE